MADFSECEEILDDRPLRQGDILRPLKEQGDPWAGITIVVTADCDIARSKHAGRLTCVPALPVTAYLGLFYLPRRLARMREQVGDRLIQLMRQAQSAHFANFSQPITAERAQQWVIQSAPATIAERLQLSAAESEKFLPLADSFREVHAAAEAPFSHQCEVLYRAGEALGRQVAAMRTTLAAELASHLKGLPGDAMFLTSLGAEYGEGYVVYLRVLRELTDSQVALKPSSRSFEITHERIAHLRPPYLYRLTQQLGAVFSSIGLPTDYESARDAIGQTIL